jgi:para-nitrobenzyl esterase
MKNPYVISLWLITFYVVSVSAQGQTLSAGAAPGSAAGTAPGSAAGAAPVSSIAEVPLVPVAKTAEGYIKGLNENGIAVFKGIPYAQPPLDTLRYAPPVSIAPWTDTLSAISFGASSLQPSGGRTVGAEGCLYLNVYTPALDNGHRPVVVWVHGGSMTNGSGSGMNGHAFSDKDGIVTITINYRLGALGFLYLGDLGTAYRQSGNLGLLDVIAALKWIHENVASFGGDPWRVTVMGESAGAKLLSAVMVSPASKGLYQQAILESGSVQCIRDTMTAKNARTLLLKELGLGPDDAAKLLTLPADTILKAQAKVCDGIGGNSFFGPVYDGITIPQNAYDYAQQGNLTDVKAIIGTNENEGAAFASPSALVGDVNASVFEPLFRSNAPLAYKYFQKQLASDSPYVALVKTMTQYMYQIHSYRFAKALTSAGTQVWMYRYNYQNGKSLGARHGDELHYIWGAAGILSSDADPAKKQLASSLHGAWVAFIKTGDPNLPGAGSGGTSTGAPASTSTGSGLPHWPTYDDFDRQVMVFDAKDTLVQLKEVYNDKLFPSAVFVIR